jgi:hypothetical protein
MEVPIHVEIAVAARSLEGSARPSFSKAELLAEVSRLFGDRRAGVGTHASKHCVATAEAEPASADFRYLTRVRRGIYRPYRKGDPFHPSRSQGAIAPDASLIPPSHRHLF